MTVDYQKVSDKDQYWIRILNTNILTAYYNGNLQMYI